MRKQNVMEIEFIIKLIEANDLRNYRYKYNLILVLGIFRQPKI